MELDTQAASGKFPCESVMAEASAALEAESVPWLRWLSHEEGMTMTCGWLVRQHFKLEWWSFMGVLPKLLRLCKIIYTFFLTNSLLICFLSFTLHQSCWNVRSKIFCNHAWEWTTSVMRETNHESLGPLWFVPTWTNSLQRETWCFGNYDPFRVLHLFSVNLF